MSETFSHPVLAALRHNGTRYAPDDPERSTVDLTHREARPLKNLKVVGEPLTDAPEEQDPPSVDPAGSDPAATGDPVAPALERQTSGDRSEKIADAIAALDPEKDYTQSGTPKVKAVEAAAGFDVTADEVAAAWAALKLSE